MKTLKILILSATLLFCLGLCFAPRISLARSTDPGAAATSTNAESGKSSCENSTPTELNRCLKENPIVKDIQKIADFMSALVGIVVVGNIIFAGIQYSMAGDNASEVQKAKSRIQNALLALAAYLMIFGFVQWIIPGGLFS